MTAYMNRTIKPSIATQIKDMPVEKVIEKDDNVVAFTIYSDSSQYSLQYVIVNNNIQQTQTIEISTKVNQRQN